jgi:hypothetical protein
MSQRLEMIQILEPNLLHGVVSKRQLIRPYPGSRVNIQAGTYPERLNLNVSGKAGNIITFQPLNHNGLAADGTPTRRFNYIQRL